MFKAWDNKNKRWADYFVINSEGGIVSLSWNTLYGVYILGDILDATLCRSTGLKDKKGNLIFESDIVEFEPFDPDHYKGDYLPQQKFEVKLNGRYWLKDERSGFEGELLLSSIDCEIIGNVFENKNLLETKNE